MSERTFCIMAGSCKSVSIETIRGLLGQQGRPRSSTTSEADYPWSRRNEGGPCRNGPSCPRPIPIPDPRKSRTKGTWHNQDRQGTARTLLGMDHGSTPRPYPFAPLGSFDSFSTGAFQINPCSCLFTFWRKWCPQDLNREPLTKESVDGNQSNMSLPRIMCSRPLVWLFCIIKVDSKQINHNVCSTEIA